MSIVIVLLSLAGLVTSSVWLWYQPGFEPAAGLLTSLVGLVASAAQDPQIATQLRRWRSRRIEARVASVEGPRRETLHLGREDTNLCIIDGTGTDAIAPANIVCELDRAPLKIPPELAHDIEAITVEEGAKAAQGRPHAWNGRMAHVARFAVSRTPDREESRLHITLQVGQYFHAMATAYRVDAEYRRVGLASPTRRRLLGEFSNWRFEPPPNLVNGLPINLVVFTRDRYLVMARRSDAVAVAPGVIAAAVNENIHPDDDYLGSDGRRLSMENLIRRALRQELGWSDPADSASPGAAVQLLAFGVHTGTGAFGIFGYVELPMDFPDLLNTFGGSCRDKLETQALIPIESDLKTICRFIHVNALYDAVGANIWLALVHRGFDPRAIQTMMLVEQGVLVASK